MDPRLEAKSVRIEAVIFDVDGTLIDSVDEHALCWQQTLARFGRRVPFQAVRAQIGKGGDQLLPVFLTGKDVAIHQRAISAFHDELFRERGLKTLRAFPGVRELFLALRARDIEVALASSAKAEELEVYKRLAGIDDLVAAETSKSEVKRSKPAPDIFAAALRKLRSRAPPKNVRVVGDSPYDIEAARKIGIPAIAVLSGGFDEEALRDAGCVAVYRGPEDLLSRIDRWTVERPAGVAHRSLPGGWFLEP